MADHLLLGIDTGGTYTDAVLFSEANGVLAKAKALTTRHDLAVGISGAVDLLYLQQLSALLGFRTGEVLSGHGQVSFVGDNGQRIGRFDLVTKNRCRPS